MFTDTRSASYRRMLARRNEADYEGIRDCPMFTETEKRRVLRYGLRAVLPAPRICVRATS